jgi:hypothetical protein
MPEAQASPAGEPVEAFPRSATNEYRKRPVVIEAVQYGLAEGADEPAAAWRIPASEYFPTWLAQALKDGVVKHEFRSEDYWYFTVSTLEGVMTGGPDDWLIRGVEGELYPCADRIFQATYVAA